MADVYPASYDIFNEVDSVLDSLSLDPRTTLEEDYQQVRVFLLYCKEC
jgi:hypothetical protein